MDQSERELCSTDQSGAGAGSVSLSCASLSERGRRRRWTWNSPVLPAPAASSDRGITPRLPVSSLTVRTLPHSVVKLRHGSDSPRVLIACQDSYCLLASYRNLPPYWPPVAQSKLLQSSLSSTEVSPSLPPPGLNMGAEVLSYTLSPTSLLTYL